MARMGADMATQRLANGDLAARNMTLLASVAAKNTQIATLTGRITRRNTAIEAAYGDVKKFIHHSVLTAYSGLFAKPKWSKQGDWSTNTTVCGTYKDAYDQAVGMLGTDIGVDLSRYYGSGSVPAAA